LSAAATAGAPILEPPGKIVVGAIHPDPFSTQTTIPSTVKHPAIVRFTVFDALGRALSRGVAEALPAGDHIRRFDAGALPSGTYFYRIEAGERAVTRSMRIVC